MAADIAVTESYRFIVQVARGRWFSVFASFLVMLGAGITHMFGTYSKAIKTAFNYNQTQVNTLGFAKDLGANFGVIAGLLAEVAPPWVLVIVGSFLNFFSYFIIWLAVTHRISEPAFWQMCVLLCLATNSQNFANTAILVSNVQNFPDKRGVILGLLKGFTGIGGAVITQVYLAIYGNKDASKVILLLAWLPTAVSLILFLAIRRVESQKQTDELRVFYQFLYVSILLALFLMVVTIMQRRTPFSSTAYAGCVTIICGILCLPLLIAVREEYALFKLDKVQNLTAPIGVPNVSIFILNPKQPAPAPVATLHELTDSPPPPKSCLSDIFNKPERGEDYPIFQALLSKDMACLFVSTMCGTGATIATIDNLGQIGESLGYPSKSISVFISLVSIFNFFGRVFSGFISETLLVKYKFPRPLMLSVFHLLTSVGQLFIAFPSQGSVYAASLIIGFAFGAQVPLTIAIISEIFGLKHYSTLFNCGQLAVPIGSYLLNVEIIGSWYDSEAKKGGLVKSGEGLTCMGSHCFSGSFMIMSVVTLFGASTSLFLAFRTREFYKGGIYKKFRENTWIQHIDMEFYCLDSKINAVKEKRDLK